MNSDAPVNVKSRDTRSLVLHYELMINRPVRDVWPLLFEYGKWNPEHVGAKIIRLAGRPNEEGDTILEFKRKDGGYLPPIVIEVVKVIPLKKLVWKMHDPQESPEIYFVDFSLQAVGDETKFVYNSCSEILNEKFKDMPSEEAFGKLLGNIFLELKKFSEARYQLNNQ